MTDSLRNVLTRVLASAASGHGRSAALLVLTYHRVPDQPDPLLPDEPDARQFSRQLDFLKGAFNVLPLVEACERLAQGRLPARAVCITFDDGYANNCEVALPILRAKGLPATVFIAPGFLNGGVMFNDVAIEAVRAAGAELDLTPLGLPRFPLPDAAARRAAIAEILPRIKSLDPSDRYEKAEGIAAIAGCAPPTRLMMTDAQVRKLHRAGIEIGAHTVNHPILTSVPEQVAREEIQSSKSVLESLLGAPVTVFAYPNGKPGRDYDSRHVAMVREAGFSLAVSTAWGAAVADGDRYQVPRVAPWHDSSLRTAVRMVRAYRDRSPEHAV